MITKTLYNQLWKHCTKLATSIGNHSPPSSCNPSTPSANAYTLPDIPCIGSVRGQKQAKLALLIAAAGKHNVLMIGPPGEGKSFIASTIPGFLPPLTSQARSELTYIYSSLGRNPPNHSPFRSIGPTITLASLIGGGRGEPIPGEIALAHSGVLFIDELPQFGKPLIDSLRQPLEDGIVTVSRSGNAATFPCAVQLIAAMNPCPCGYLGYAPCHCTPFQVNQYQRKLSGPILDRIDMIVKLAPIKSAERYSPAIPQQSKAFLARVLDAQLAQYRRQQKLNSQLGPDSIFSPGNKLAFLEETSLSYFKELTDKSRYSTRRTVRLARVCRTVADVFNSPTITREHIDVASRYVDATLSTNEELDI